MLPRYSWVLEVRLIKVICLFILAQSIAVANVQGEIKTKHLPNRNPTSYIYDKPLHDVRAAVVRLHAIRAVLFKLPKDVGTPELIQKDPYVVSSMIFETAQDASPFSVSIFKTPANNQDTYLHSFHNPIAISAVYFRKNRPLLYIASFHLHLTALTANTTKVEIYTHDSEVIELGGRLPGVHGVQSYKYVKVPPTTIEEYCLLKRLGAELGMKDMPEIVLPE
jgi:hypothetical protein